MKFICNQQTLSRALNTVSKAVSTRTTLPILRGIMIEAKDGSLVLSASDLEISIKKTINADVLEEGAAVVPSRLFGDIIRKLPSEDITIEDEDNNVLIKTMSSQFNVITMAIDEFPSINENNDSEDVISIDPSMLRDMIRKTSFAASVEESKGTLVGILTEIQDDTVSMVALDGFRLALVRKEMIGSGNKKFIIAAKIMNELSKITADEPDIDVVRLHMGQKRAVAEAGNTEVTIRIMEGDYIRYRDIIPKESSIKVRVNKVLLLEAIERASLLAKEGKNNLIKMSISGDMMTITSRSEDGNVKEQIGIEKEGEDLDIGFNSKYVIDVLKVIDDEEIMMNFKSGITPCIISPVEGNEYEYLVLPVRIPNM